MTLTTTRDELVTTLADSLRSQWRKILDHGGGVAITALDPVVMDVARNLAQALMVFDTEQVDLSSPTDPSWSVAQHVRGMT